MNDIWDDISCSVCGEQFSEEDWDIRHSADDGSDIHEHCCEECENEISS